MQIGQWVDEICGNLVSNDVNLSEIIVIIETLMWIRSNQLSNCLILSNFLVIVDSINGNTRIRDRYNHYTSICSELLQEGSQIQLQKVERDQVREADILASTIRQGSRKVNVFRQFCTDSWVELNINLDDISFEQLCHCSNKWRVAPYMLAMLATRSCSISFLIYCAFNQKNKNALKKLRMLILIFSRFCYT